MHASLSRTNPFLVVPLKKSGAEPTMLTFEAIANAPHILVVGESGSGKSTTLKKLISYRNGGSIVADPHNHDDKWAVPSFGGGEDWPDIVRLLQRFQALMGERYAAGEPDRDPHARVTLVLDELRGLFEHAPEAIPIYRDILTRGRAANIGLIAVSHDDSAAAVGLAGEYKLLHCYSYRVYLGAVAVSYMPSLAGQDRPRVACETATDCWLAIKDDDDDAA